MGQTKLRADLIERRIMEVELILDGLATHDNFMHCMNPIHSKRIKRALSAIRSARDLFRNDIASRQLTLPTRSKQLNRSGVNWHYGAKSELQCDCKQKLAKRKTLKGIWTDHGRKPKIPIRKENKLL